MSVPVRHCSSSNAMCICVSLISRRIRGLVPAGSGVEYAPLNCRFSFEAASSCDSEENVRALVGSPSLPLAPLSSAKGFAHRRQLGDLVTAPGLSGVLWATPFFLPPSYDHRPTRPNSLSSARGLQSGQATVALPAPWFELPGLILTKTNA